MKFLTICITIMLLFSCQSNNNSSNTETVTMSGSVELVIEKEGTYSEVRYYILISSEGRNIMFNEKGFSDGFQKWLGQQVQVEYEPYIGSIGFKREEEFGIKIFHISNSF